MSGNILEQESGQAQDVRVEISTCTQSSSESDQVFRERRNKCFELYKAALNGNWNIAEPIFNNETLPVSTRISRRKETALHISAAANHTHFAKQLVDMMSGEELALTNINNNTAFFFVATSGNVELAKAMMKKNSELATIRGSGDDKLLPLFMAALYGHREMVLYLYEETGDKSGGKLGKDDGINLFIALLKRNLYDVALKLLDDKERAADYQEFFACGANEQMLLDLLARKPQMYSCFTNESEQGIWNRCIKIFSGNNGNQNKTSEHQELLVKRLWEEIIKLGILKSREHFKKLIFVAAKRGNVELLTTLIHSYPELIWEKDENEQTIFHIAVLYRHEDIFKWIHEIGWIKNLIASYKDKGGNNMLHMAGKLAPLNRLKIMPGAALQLQRELLWFEEVKKIMQPQDAEAKNEEHKTPEDLFTEQHSDLMKEGEKWMRGTANSCMLVATLIATVVFAAAFTVPGGNKDQTGIPIFLESISFKIFAVSDAISLLFSCTSILVFLSILTSRYTKEDFRRSLPNKLIIGLVTLFISIAAMMAAFSATFYIVFNHGLHWFVIVVATIAFVPVILFACLHHHLFIDIIRAQPIDQRSVFHLSKRTLFPKKD